MTTTGTTNESKGFESAVQRIEHLKALFQANLINEDEFNTRRDQIINELTGTTNQSTRRTMQSRRKASMMASATVTQSRNGSSYGYMSERADFVGSPIHFEQRLKRRISGAGITQLKKHPPPNWDDPNYPEERAVKVTYDFHAKKWERKDVRVKIDTKPFDKGGLRLVFHLKDMSEPQTAYVMKMSRDPRDNQSESGKAIYYEDVRMQAFCAHFANQFNTYIPPKKVKFLEAFVLELKQRAGSPVCGVEKFISGEYKKYNNNRGWVSDMHRNTPAAFSHFSYIASEKKFLICDVQGVGDVYTDPQMHSENGEGFGKGNLGQEGIKQFLKTHRCNRICKFLKIASEASMMEGTMPKSTHMFKNKIDRVDGLTQMNVPLLQDNQYRFPALRTPPEKSWCPCL